MQKIFFLFFAGFIAASATAGNLIKNGDFENGTQYFQPYRGNWKEPCNPLQIIPVNDPQHGRMAASVEAKNGIHTAGISYALKLPEKVQTYHISLQLKLISLQNGWVQLSLQRLVDQNGRRKIVPLWSQVPFASKKGDRQHDWTAINEDFTLPPELPPGRDFLVLRLAGHQVAGQVLFDNIKLEPFQAAAPAAAPAPQGNLRSSGINLIRDHWSCRTTSDCVLIQQQNNTFSAEIPAGKKAIWNYTVYSIYDNLQGPMRFSFQSRYRINGVLRCTLFPSLKKHDTVHIVKPVGKPDSEGFQTYAVEFTPLEKNGRMVITLTSGSQKRPTRMQVKNITLERMVPADGKVSLYKVRHGNTQGLFLKSENACSNFEFENATTIPQTLPLTVEVGDLYGRKVYSAKKLLTLPPQSITIHPIKYPKFEQVGFYSVAAQWPENGQINRYRGGFVTVEPPLENPDRMFAFSPWDGNIAWQNADAQKLIGCGLKAITFFGRFVQDSNFVELDKSVAAYEKRNMTVVGTLVLPPGRFLPKFKPDPEKLKRKEFPYSDDYFQEAHKRITALARHYKGRIKYWILYDELDCSVLRYYYAVEHYVRLAKVVSEAFKAVDPEIIVTGLTVTTHDNKAVPRYPILRQVWPQLKNHLDGLSLDAYSAGNTFGPNWTPQDPVAGEFKTIVQAGHAIAQADGKTRLSIHERGYAHTAGLPIDGDHALAEAKAWAADYVLAKTMPELEFFLTYTWRWGNDGFNREFGIMRHENATPAAAVFAAAARRLAHIKYLRKITLQYNAIECYAFKRNATTVIPLWISSDPSDFNISTSFRCPAIPGLKTYDFQGNEIPIKTAGQDIILQLGAAPLYLESDLDPEKFAKLIQQGQCELPEITADMMLYRADTVRSYIKNLTTQPLKTQLELLIGNQKVTLQTILPPSAITPVDFAIPHLSTQADPECRLTCITPDKKRYQTNRNLENLPLRKVVNMQALEQLPPTADMDGRSCINDLDSVANKVWADNNDCSARVRLGYNDTYLMLSVQVSDELHITPWNGKEIWKGDSIQFAFESARDAVKRKMQNQIGFIQSDRLFTAALVDQQPIFYNAPATAGKSAAIPEILRNEEQKITIYRFSIPWTELGIKPQPGMVIGFALMIADTDWEKRQFQYRLELGHGIDGAYHDPSKLLSLIIE